MKLQYIVGPKNWNRCPVFYSLYCIMYMPNGVVCAHCPKNNPNLRIKNKPVTVAADTNVYVQFYWLEFFGLKKLMVGLKRSEII